MLSLSSVLSQSHFSTAEGITVELTAESDALNIHIEVSLPL